MDSAGMAHGGKEFDPDVPVVGDRMALFDRDYFFVMPADERPEHQRLKQRMGG
ncbi:MAG: hypothetical protein ACT4OM_10620 [Actinomycetota bacterium]